MGKNYSRIPSSGSTNVDAGGVVIADIVVRPEYGQESYGRMYILIKNVGADDFSSLTFRHSFDGTNFEKFALISDAQAAEIAAKLIGGGSAAMAIPIPLGTLRLEGTSAGIDCEAEVYYSRFDAEVEDVVVDGFKLDRVRQITEVENGTVTADNTDTITYTINHDTDVATVQNIGMNDVLVNFGVDSNGGLDGIWLKRCDDDGGGLPILGTGGAVEVDKFKGDLYFYCAATSDVNIVVQK